MLTIGHVKYKNGLLYNFVTRYTCTEKLLIFCALELKCTKNLGFTVITTRERRVASIKCNERLYKIYAGAHNA